MVAIPPDLGLGPVLRHVTERTGPPPSGWRPAPLHSRGRDHRYALVLVYQHLGNLAPELAADEVYRSVQGCWTQAGLRLRRVPTGERSMPAERTLACLCSLRVNNGGGNEARRR